MQKYKNATDLREDLNDLHLQAGEKKSYWWKPVLDKPTNIFGILEIIIENLLIIWIFQWKTNGV